MATYKAKGTYNDKPLTAQETARVAQYKQAYETAKAAGDTAGMRKAHDAAEAIRAMHGYSGGGDGSENLSMVKGGGQKYSTGTPTAKSTVSRNQSSTIQNAQTALNQVPQMSNADWTAYNRQGITSQQGALDMMRLGSNLWNASQYDTIRSGLADENAAIAQQWFPGATRDQSGVWYYNGRPLYDQDFSQSTFRPEGEASSGLQDLLGAALSGEQQNGTADAAIKALLGNTGLSTTPGVFLEMGEVGKSQPQTAYSLDGGAYSISSAKGLNFLFNASPGESMVGGDGSRWSKNEDGSVIIDHNGKRYTFGGNIYGITPEPFDYMPFDQTEAGKQMASSLNDLYDRLNNYQAFSYDPNTDPLYLQYADSYTRGGQRAMTDILGQLAARTGGLASSYAGSMAQQTYDNYMADLAGKIPELQQLAYSMYVDDYNRQVGNYDRAFNRYRDAYDRYGQDTQFQYNMWQDDLANRWRNLENTQEQAEAAKSDYWKGQELQWQKDSAQKEFDYRKEQDALAREDMMRQERAQNLSLLIDMIQGGYIPTEEDAIRYNLTPAQLAQYRKWAIENNSQKSDKWHISGAY